MNTAPITASTDWKEQVDPGEVERFEAYAEKLRLLQHRLAGATPVSRALHAKTQLALEGEFAVQADLPLPPEARAGLFAEPRTYKAYVRFSNAAGKRQSDRKGDVRGVAIKVVGVAGKKLIPGMEDAVTQDFLMIRDRATPFRDGDEFASFVLAMTSPLTGLPGFIARFGLGRTLKILKTGAASLGRPIASLATTDYHSAAPIQLGRYAVHYGLRPRAVPEAGAKPGGGPDYLADELAARFARGPVSYDFGVQFFRDEISTPIEDGAVPWTDEVSPFVPLARLTLPTQDPTSPRGQRVAAFVERLSFDPWHALVELRPLGSLMRARNVTYRVSTKERVSAPEPNGSEQLG